MGRHVVAPVAELTPGARKIVDVEGLSIGVFNIAGQFYALKNRCPHQGPPLCLGSLKGTTLPSTPGEYQWGREGEILRCPWHGWEFDVTNGRSVWNPHGCRVQAYEVTVELQHDRVETPEDEGDTDVETYPVTVEGELVVVHV